MLAVLKHRFVSSLLVGLMLGHLTAARPADAPAPRGPAPTVGKTQVMARQELRSLSRREVWQTIQNELVKRGIRAAGNLRPQDLTLQSAVPVFKNDLGLQVKKIGFDPIRREIVFELWASNEPQYLPFEVTTRRDPASLGLAQLPDLNWGETVGASKEFHRDNPEQGKNRLRSQLPVLAKPGKPATLVITGENIRITTTVVPLQPGSKGQCIRVRDPASALIMTAEVVDEGLLRASF